MRIKDWHKFQHFKDRKPPWIKLYRDILDDLEWHDLDDKAAKVLVMLWVIASEDDGNIPDMKKLAFRLRMRESDVINCCSKLSHWLIHDDITVISERYQHDALERETETEVETKKEKETEPLRKRSAPPQLSKPEDVAQQTWDDWLTLRKAKKAPATGTVVAGARVQAEKAGMPLEDFLQVWCRRGSQGLEAAWLKPDERGHTQSFAERDEIAKRKRWEEMTGRPWPTDDIRGVIDITPTSPEIE